MIGTMNQSINLLKEDERLSIDRNSPMIFAGKALTHQRVNSIVESCKEKIVDEAHLFSSLSLKEERNPFQKSHSFGEDDALSSRTQRLSPDTDLTPPSIPRRRFSRRNSKTASMLATATLAVQQNQEQQFRLNEQHRRQRRNSAESSLHKMDFGMNIAQDVFVPPKSGFSLDSLCKSSLMKKRSLPVVREETPASSFTLSTVGRTSSPSYPCRSEADSSKRRRVSSPMVGAGEGNR